MKRVLFFITLFAITLLSWAYDIKVGGIYYYVDAQNKTARVTSKERYAGSYSGKVVIPTSIVFKGVSLKVTSIGGWAFANCKQLISITIPNTIKYIEDNAFENCSGLTSITIPNSVIGIGKWAFSGCTNLTSITIPQNVEYVGDFAFSGCSRLNSIKIYQKLTTIGVLAFRDCKELKNVYLYFVSVPKSSDNIFYGAFIEFANLYVPFGTSSIIKTKSPWNLFSKIVELNDEFSKGLGEKAKQREAEELARQAEELARQKMLEELPGPKEFEEEEFDDEMPEFPGGEEKMLEYLGENIHYPERAREQGVQGRCIIEIVINPDGSIVEPKVVRSLEAECDNEAMRVINLMPKWKPGKRNGKPVRVKYTVPVQFKLK